MTAILSWLATNALLATVLAAAALCAGLCRCRPAVLHALWLLVLLKLATPPLLRLPLPEYRFAAAPESSPASESLAAIDPRPPTARDTATADALTAPFDPAAAPPLVLPSAPPAVIPAPLPALPAEAPAEPSAPLALPSPPGAVPSAAREIPGEFGSDAPEPAVGSRGFPLATDAPPAAALVPQATAQARIDANVEPRAAASGPRRSFSFLRAYFAPALFACWLGGALLWWGRAVLRMARFRQALAVARPAGDDVQRRVQAWAGQLGLRRAPPALLLDVCVPPLLWSGCFRPRLLLPEPLWSSLSTEQQDSVLVHELAHLRRGDHLVRWLELFALGAYWWLPVAWQARRELQRTEELCCDAWVVWALPAAGQAYARALLDTAAFVAAERVLLPAGASGMRPLAFLKRRIAMVLQAETPRGLSWRGKVLWAALAAAFLPLGFVLGQGQPEDVPPLPTFNAFVPAAPAPGVPAPAVTAPAGGEFAGGFVVQQPAVAGQAVPLPTITATMPADAAETVQRLQRRLLELDVREAQEDLAALERQRDRAFELQKQGVAPAEDLDELDYKVRRAAGRYERAQIQLRLFDLQTVQSGAYGAMQIPMESAPPPSIAVPADPAANAVPELRYGPLDAAPAPPGAESPQRYDEFQQVPAESADPAQPNAAPGVEYRPRVFFQVAPPSAAGVPYPAQPPAVHNLEPTVPQAVAPSAVPQPAAPSVAPQPATPSVALQPVAPEAARLIEELRAAHAALETALTALQADQAQLERARAAGAGGEELQRCLAIVSVSLQRYEQARARVDALLAAGANLAQCPAMPNVPQPAADPAPAQTAATQEGPENLAVQLLELQVLRATQEIELADEAAGQAARQFAAGQIEAQWLSAAQARVRAAEAQLAAAEQRLAEARLGNEGGNRAAAVQLLQQMLAEQTAQLTADYERARQARDAGTVRWQQGLASLQELSVLERYLVRAHLELRRHALWQEYLQRELGFGYPDVPPQPAAPPETRFGPPPGALPSDAPQPAAPQQAVTQPIGPPQDVPQQAVPQPAVPQPVGPPPGLDPAVPPPGQDPAVLPPASADAAQLPPGEPLFDEAPAPEPPPVISQ